MKHLKLGIPTVDILKQQIDNKTRFFAKDSLRDAYMKAIHIDSGEKFPDAIQITINKVEQEIFDHYKDKPQEYTHTITKLVVFLNPMHYIGEFAKLFRAKAVQNVYNPQRLVQLDITDLLPEVFLNPSTSAAEKLDIYQSLSLLVTNENDDFIVHINNLHNPTRPIVSTKPRQLTGMIKKINKNKRAVKDLCENPHWDMKEVNMIICKDNGKFYCLDIEQLVSELAEKNTASNYFTKKALDPEVIDNLRTRYKDEIDELKKDHKITIGARSNEEIADLHSTMQKLQELHDVLNTKVTDVVETLSDLSAVENPEIGGKEGLLQVLPPMVRGQFEKYLDDDPQNPEKAISKINSWLIENISFIDKIIKDPEAEIEPTTEISIEDLIGEEPTTEISIEDLIGEEPEIEPKPSKKYAQLASAKEESYIKGELLKEGTIAFQVYNEYIDRLESMHDAVLGNLKSTKSISARNELTALLTDVDAKLKSIRIRGRTIKGIINLLESKLETDEKRLADMRESIGAGSGMRKIYPQEVTATLQEKIVLEESIKNVRGELEHVKQLGLLDGES